MVKATTETSRTDRVILPSAINTQTHTANQSTDPPINPQQRATGNRQPTTDCDDRQKNKRNVDGNDDDNDDDDECPLWLLCLSRSLTLSLSHTHTHAHTQRQSAMLSSRCVLSTALLLTMLSSRLVIAAATRSQGPSSLTAATTRRAGSSMVAFASTPLRNRMQPQQVLPVHRTGTSRVWISSSSSSSRAPWLVADD